MVNSFEEKDILHFMPIGDKDEFSELESGLVRDVKPERPRCAQTKGNVPLRGLLINCRSIKLDHKIGRSIVNNCSHKIQQFSVQ